MKKIPFRSFYIKKGPRRQWVLFTFFTRGNIVIAIIKSKSVRPTRSRNGKETLKYLKTKKPKIIFEVRKLLLGEF